MRREMARSPTELKAGLVAQGLAGRIWTKIDGTQEILWNFGDKPFEPEGLLFEMSPDSPKMNLIWDEKNIF